jgi:NitT/TauT family transport system permease protein
MAKVYRLSRWQKLRHLYLPSMRPFFSAAALSSIGLAWKAGIAAEVICRPQFSMGRELYESKIYLEMPDLFAWTIAVILLSMALEQLFRRLLARRGA